MKRFLIAALLATLTCTTSAVAATKQKTVTIWMDNQAGWTFMDENGLPCGTPNCEFVAENWDEPPSPSGDGSALLQKDLAGQKPILPMLVSATAVRRGTLLRDVTELSYSTRVVWNENHEALVLALDIDLDLADANDGWQGSLVFDPALQPGVQILSGSLADDWQTWDAIDDGDALWFWQAPAGVVNNPCTAIKPCTWDEVQAIFPNIGLHRFIGRLAFRTSGTGIQFYAQVDALVVTIGDTDSTLYDFEAGPASQASSADSHCLKYFQKAQKYQAYGKPDKAAKYFAKFDQCQAADADPCLKYYDKSVKYLNRGKVAKSNKYYAKYLKCQSR